ncbi:integrase family protein [Caballeronia udeis]|uniref:Integrase family protein n=1 Tax=Caballeronia udeis TaxID=1232866 RepID=A0A158JIJ5_9BURK|nr:integrase family protein [Caballeronia udeis]
MRTTAILSVFDGVSVFTEATATWPVESCPVAFCRMPSRYTSVIQRVSRSQGKMAVTALRSFLRFLLQRGAIQTDLARTLPGVACWRLSHLPRSLPPDQVERLLACCDRSTPGGERDYAILVLVARLVLVQTETVNGLESSDYTN